jgi:hypothetical protein
MFNLERFKQQLAETIAWCAPRVQINDLRNSLRTVLPASVQELWEYDLNMRLVDSAVAIRSALFEASFRRKYTAWKKPVPPLPSGLAGGRLLVFYPGSAIWDPAAEVESNGYFNGITIPAWDTWVYSGVEVVSRSNGDKDIEYLICWIPPQILEWVDNGIEVDPTECIEWLDKTKPPLSFADTLKDAGLLG